MADKLNAGIGIGIDSSISRKVINGALWVTAASILARVLTLVSGIILARLLVPEDFGLMAIAMSIIAFSQSSTSTGFMSALIQKQDNPEDFLNTAWTYELVRYLVLFLIILVAAPVLAAFFKEPRAVAILRVVSLSLVFTGLRNVGVVYFRKNLEFHKQFVMDIVPLVAYILMIIPLAFYLRNVWALVLANLISIIMDCFVSYVMHPYRPSLDFRIKKARSLFDFGKWVFGLGLLGIIRDQGIIMFVGKFLGIPMLGYYNRAEAFSTMIFQQVNDIVWKVGYPAYSQLQLDPNRFKRAYLKTLQFLTFIGIPMAGGLFVLSHDFVHLFLTDKWLPAVPLMQILCLQAILNLISTPADVTFQALGRPSIGTKISLLRVIILIIVCYPLSSMWGITGAVTSLFLATLIPSPIVWYMAIKTTRVTFMEFFIPVLIALINTGIMVCIIIVLKQYILNQVHMPVFFFLIFAGMIIYLACASFFDRYMNYGVYNLIKSRITATL